MIQSVFTIGIILTIVMLVLSFILTRRGTKSFGIYFPFAALFFIGLILLLFATILERTFVLGAGLGGWGIACIFAAAISWVVTAILDAYAQPDV